MGAAGEESDDGDGDNLASSRTSSSVFFDDPADAEQPLLQRLRARWSAAARLPLALAEPTQLTRYAGGESYGLHLDASDGVPRTATLLTYLSDDFDGGETRFVEPPQDGQPTRGPTVTPHVGDVLIFTHPVLHEGNTVTKGRKYVLRTEVMYADR